MSSRIEGRVALPEVFGRFPAEERIGRSEAWFPGDVLGIAGLGSGYAVRYARGQVSWTAFAISLKEALANGSASLQHTCPATPAGSSRMYNWRLLDIQE